MANDRENLESFFAISFDLLCITDASGNILKVKTACQDVLGYSMAELNNKRILDFVHPDDMQYTLYCISDMNQRGEPLEIVHRCQCKDGNYKYLEWRIQNCGEHLCAAARETADPVKQDAFNAQDGHESNHATNKFEIERNELPRRKILLVDDSMLNLMILMDALKDEYEVFTATNGEDAITVAESDNPPDLILLDIIMSGMNGYEVCAKLSANFATKDIPIIFVTGIQDEKSQEQGLKLGAIDYITKPFSMPIIKAKVKNHLELKEYKDLLKSISWIDGLTQIANRRRFDVMLETEIKRAKRGKRCVSMLMADIDCFKNYNDTYGHLAGDECLQKVARAIENSLKRPGDLAARWGGEEFTILLPDIDGEKALHVAERIRKAVEALGILHETSDVSKVVTISIGVATLDSSNSIYCDNLVLHADRALYKAKKMGKNRVCRI